MNISVVPRPPGRIISPIGLPLANASAGHRRIDTSAGEAFPARIPSIARRIAAGAEVAADADDALDRSAVPRELGPDPLERTNKLERTNTYTSPAPLPPSPSPTEGVEPWLEPGAVNEGSVPDLGALAGDSSSISSAYYTADSPRRSSAPSIVVEITPQPEGFMQIHPWRFSLLLGTTCLVVGMVLGALIFGP